MLMITFFDELKLPRFLTSTMTDAGGRSSLGAITQHNPPPNNALYIEFHQSDGESSRWPQPCPGPSRDSDGKLNYYRPIGLDEHASTDWRKKIGFKVAELMKKPSEPPILFGFVSISSLDRPLTAVLSRRRIILSLFVAGRIWTLCAYSRAG